jgi:hypothetical protein
MAEIFRKAIGDLGSTESAPLALYCVCVIAGHVLQQVALADRITRGLPHQAPDVISVTTSSGKTYVFGDAIAGALIRSGDQPRFIEWMAKQAEIPSTEWDLQGYFERSAATVGSEEYGRPSPPFGTYAWPLIDDVIANADSVVTYLRSGSLSPNQFGDILTNAARLALLRAADNRFMGTLADFAIMGIEAAIAGSHVLPPPITTSTD